MTERLDPCPAYYLAQDFEVWDVAEAWGLDKDAYLFNVLKYISRAGKKNAESELADLKKARSYIQRRIEKLEG